MSEPIHPGHISAMLWNSAKEYLSAAGTLIHGCKTIIPAYFLLSHALELTLKSYLVAHGVPTDEIASRKIGHDLRKAYERATALGLKIDNDKVPLVIHALADFHRDYVFRYPIIKNTGELVVIGGLVHADELHSAIQVILDKVLKDALGAKLRAASKGGQYPIETWVMGGRDHDEIEE